MAERGVSRVRLNRAMGDVIPLRTGADASRPVRIGLPNGGCRTRIRIETQDHQRGCAPCCPVAETGKRPPVTAQPGHRGARDDSVIIARPGDYGNRHSAGNGAPRFPAMELGQIVCPHEPDELAPRVTSCQRAQGIDGKAGTQFPFHRADPNRRTPRHLTRRSEAGGERCHPGGALQRISGRYQPPRLIQTERRDGAQRDPPVPAMRGIEAAAQKRGAGNAPGQGRAFRDGPGRCRAPATCRWSALQGRPARARADGRWRYRFLRQGRIRRHRQTGCWR